MYWYNNFYFIFVGAPVIQGPSEVIFRPGEGPVELTCIHNTTAGTILWRVNGSSALFAGDFPGHTAVAGGITLVVVNATNNTQYICVLFVQSMVEMVQTDSEPVYLYIAGMLIVWQSYMCTYVYSHLCYEYYCFIAWSKVCRNFRIQFLNQTHAIRMHLVS